MTCPNCGHVYPISNGIPNMVRILCALFQSLLFLIFLRISRFSYWQRTRSGSVLALMRQYTVAAGRVDGFMEIQARIIGFYSTREVFTEKHVSWMARAGGTGIRARIVLLRRSTLKRSEAKVLQTQSRDTNSTHCNRVAPNVT